METKTLTNKLKEVVSQFPDTIIMQTKKANGVYRRYQYQEFYNIAQSIGCGLVKLGVKKSDRIAIVLENRPEWGCVYFGILLAGTIAVPLDPQSSAKDIEYFIKDSGAKFAFTSNQLYPVFELAQGLKKIILLGDNIKKPNVIYLSDMQVFDEVKLPKILSKDLASILYTSGTTGKPKGVMLTHKNFYSNFQSIEKLNFFKGKQNILSILPLHHSFPFMVTLLIPLLVQCKITYISSRKREDLLQCMQETNVTVLVGVPQFFYIFYKQLYTKLHQLSFFVRLPLKVFLELFYLLRRLTKINFAKLFLPKIHHAFGKHLKFFACGGAKLDKNVTKFLVKLGFTILEGYGLTETAPIVTFNPQNKQKIGSAGKVIPDVKLKITNPDEKGIGEIIVHGPNVMKGYYKKEKKTKEALKKHWFYTGDLGCLDKDGYLYITGRKKELIVLGSGKNITPEEVEAHYLESPFIKELCVLAVGEGQEEKLAAVIVPDLDYYHKIKEVNFNWTIKRSLENLSKQYPAYKRIMGFVLTQQELPRTRLGKLKRFQIRDQYLDELMGKGIRKEVEESSFSEQDLNILTTELWKKIVKILENESLSEYAIHLTDHLEIDLGFDSLERIEFAAALEKHLEIKIPSSLIAQVFTVKELFLAIEKLISSEKPMVLKASPKVQARSALWKNILTAKPAKEILHKINLFPTKPIKILSIAFCDLCYLMFKGCWWLKIVNAENLPNEGAYILCPNHTSYLDAFLVAASVPTRMVNRLFFLGFRAFFEVPVIRNMIRLSKTIPVDPGIQLIDAMQASSYVLRHKKVMCIFPEAGRSIDGEIKTFKKGVGILAKELKVPIIPVYIKGSYEIWPRTFRFPRLFRPVSVIFGRPYTPNELKKFGKKLGAKNDYEAIALGIREKVKDLEKLLC